MICTSVSIKHIRDTLDDIIDFYTIVIKVLTFGQLLCLVDDLERFVNRLKDEIKIRENSLSAKEK